jgi:hypothetical protein
MISIGIFFLTLTFHVGGSSLASISASGSVFVEIGMEGTGVQTYIKANDLCRWECTTAYCPLYCQIVVAPPSCDVYCYNVTNETHPIVLPSPCTSLPRCFVDCDSDNLQYVNSSCPSCSIVCEELECGELPENIVCDIRCSDDINASWNCYSDRHCMPPYCDLKCDEPVPCKGIILGPQMILCIFILLTSFMFIGTNIN